MACRSALHRHLSHHRPSVNLFVDGGFSKSNKVLDLVLKAKKKAGSEPAENHKQPVSDDDWKLVQEHFADIFTTLDPCKLTTYVWFVASSHFCLRRGELSSVQTEEARSAIREWEIYAGHGFHDQEPSRGTDRVCIDGCRLHQGRCASGCYASLREQASPWSRPTLPTCQGSCRYAGWWKRRMLVYALTTTA